MEVDLDAQDLGFGYFGVILAEESVSKLRAMKPYIEQLLLVPNLDFALSPID